MADEKERLATAQWILERNLAWIAAAEVKVGVIVAIDTAMLAGLGALFSASQDAERTPWVVLFTSVGLAALLISIACAGMVVMPRVGGPPQSLVFFGKVNAFTESDYVEALSKASDGSLLADWAAQIHRNAQIATQKFNWVARSMGWSFFSVVPWFVAIVLLVDKGHK